MWTQVAASRSPADVAGLTTPVVGPGGYTLSATQYELTLWIAGSSYDIVFDVAISMIAALRGIATLPQETVGWAYHRDLDPTGFIDGTENPSLSVAAGKVLMPPGSPGAGGSVPLLQKWAHDSVALEPLTGQRIGSRHQPLQGGQRRAVRPSPTARMSHVRTRTRSGRSFGAARRTARCSTTGRCSSDSAPPSVHWPRCSKAWPVSRPANATC
jgi:hypothetical protein